jgi:pimeloyl-ACP methyl ester carboxylesterase
LLRASLGQAVNEGRLIPAGDHYVRFYEEGAGSPVVVIIAGAGDCADSWVPIRHRLAAAHRVVSYDRAAIGGSDQAAPATAERYLAEPDAVTDAASPQDPVILAGHSPGGLIARLYLNARPGRVSGLVLLDSTPEAVGDDRGVRAGFVASGLAARLLKLLTPVGLTRLLLRWQKMPLYPEQSRYQAAVSPPEYDRWMTMVCASFAPGGRCRTPVRDPDRGAGEQAAGRPHHPGTAGGHRQRRLRRQVGQLATRDRRPLGEGFLHLHRHQIAQHPPAPCRRCHRGGRRDRQPSRY